MSKIEWYIRYRLSQKEHWLIQSVRNADLIKNICILAG